MAAGNISSPSGNLQRTEAYKSAGLFPGAEAAVGRPDGDRDNGNGKEEKTGVVVEISENLKEMYQKQAESAKEAADGMKDMAKLMEIARRIARGDHVPPGDEKKLAEFDSDLYQAAKMAGAMNANRKHKKHDALFEDEEEGSKEEQLRELKREAAAGDAGGSGEDVPEAESAGQLL